MSSQDQDKLEPVKNWSYPVPQKNSSGSIDPDAYMAAFRASDGTYPIGLNGFWHGGIHFDQDNGTADSSAEILDEVGGIRCIADGEVVAYKLDTDYLPLTYPDGRNGLYSSSFTLVKHRLTLPLPPATPAPAVAPASTPANQPASPSNPHPAPGAPASHPVPPSPASAPSTTSTVSTDPADTLVFFSLYMHLAPCKVYKQSATESSKKAWPSYYNAVEIYSLDAAHAEDSQSGVTTGEPIKGLHVHRGGHGRRDDWMGILSQGSKFTVTRPRNASKNWGKIVSLIEGEVVPLSPSRPVDADAAHGFVFLKNLRSEIKPDSLDAVYVLPKPIKINAGDVVGYLGEFQNAEHATLLPPSPKRALVHVEVFAGDDLEAFIRRSRQRAPQLTDEPKTQLLIEKGASLYKEKKAAPNAISLPAHATVVETSDAPKTGTWTKVKVTAGAPAQLGQTFWILRSALPGTQGDRVTWSEFPLSLTGEVAGTAGYARVVNVSRLKADEDDAHNAWYEVDVGDADMKTLNGYVRASGQAKVSLENKWAWAGFELLTSQLSNADLFKRFLYLQGSPATAIEQTEFEASFNTAKSDPLIQKLDDILTPQSQPKGKVGGAHLLAAMTVPWKANRVNHLVVKYESEWGGEPTKWSALDPIMNDGKEYWNEEKKRINTLAIWGKCNAALKPVSTATVFHIHPLSLIGNFYTLGSCDCGCCLDGKIAVTHGTSGYGPAYWGSITLASSPALDETVASGRMTESERRIIMAMAPNEGKMDSVQAWDDQIATAGAMQKTIRPDGTGELSKQVSEFRAENEQAYQELFARCGWTVEGTGTDSKMYFSHSSQTQGKTITGSDLLAVIRENCSIQTYHKYISNPAIAILAHAVGDIRYQHKQLVDFVGRLRENLALHPTGPQSIGQYSIGEYLQSELGHATLLDHCVNRPGYVQLDLGDAIGRFYQRNPSVSRNPNEWGSSHQNYEKSILDDYGVTRRMAVVGGVSVNRARYQNLKDIFD